MTEQKKQKKVAKQVTEETLNAAVAELAKETVEQEELLDEIPEQEEQTLEEAIEEASAWVDVPEPGTTDVSLSNTEADVTRRGFTTLLMARAHRNQLKNAENYLIVELRDVQSILAYYVVHRAEEL